MRPPVELGFHRAPRCEPVVSLVRSRRAPPVPLIVLPKSCSCRWGPCPRPIPRLACLFSFFLYTGHRTGHGTVQEKEFWHLQTHTYIARHDSRDRRGAGDGFLRSRRPHHRSSHTTTPTPAPTRSPPTFSNFFQLFPTFSNFFRGQLFPGYGMVVHASSRPPIPRWCPVRA